MVGAGETRTNRFKILHGWKNLFGGPVFEAFRGLDSPLDDVLSKMRVNFNTGGLFNIRRVKWERDSEMFLDYQILIESIDDPV